MRHRAWAGQITRPCPAESFLGFGTRCVVIQGHACTHLQVASGVKSHYRTLQLATTTACHDSDLLRIVCALLQLRLAIIRNDMQLVLIGTPKDHAFGQLLLVATKEPAPWPPHQTDGPCSNSLRVIRIIQSATNGPDRRTSARMTCSI